MTRPLAVIVAVALFGLFIYSSSSPIPNVPISPDSLLQPVTCNLPPSSSNVFVLNTPMLSFQTADGGEISLAEKTEVVAFFFGGTPAEFAAVGLDTTDIDLVREIKAAGNDTGLDISGDRKHATLKNGQTVYYGVKILPAAREKVTGVTFVLTTVPISGIPDIVNNFFKIRYVEAVGGRAGDVKNDSTSGKAYQVITPAGEYLYYFSFTAVVCSGGIRTKIEPHFFGGATVRDVAQDYIQCCCVHTKKPLPRVPEITSCWWYGFPYIGDWFMYWFKICLAQTAAANTSNAPCNHAQEATGKDLTITGTGFSRLSPLTPERIKITDECGTVARVTQIVSATDTEIKAKIDVTACRPGTKTVKIDGAGGFATTTLLKVVQDIPDTIVGQRRFQAVRILGTQEKLPLTMTINNGENITFAADQSFNVTCVTRGGATTATTTTTGGCNNIATTTIQGTTVPGEDTMIVTGNGIRCDAPIRNADITLVAVPEGKKALVCVGEMQEVKVTVKSPSTYYSAVTLTSSATDVIRVWADPAKTTPVTLGTTIFDNPVPVPEGSTEVTRTFWVEGLKPGAACLTATYCDKTWSKCDSVALTVMELVTLTATSSTGKNVTDDKNDPNQVTPTLYLCEDANGNGYLTLAATTNPSSTNQVFYAIEGPGATPVAGPVPSGTITLSTASGNRRFLIHAGLDCNGNGKLDVGPDSPSEVTRTIEAIVGKMLSLTVTDTADPTHTVTDATDGGQNLSLTFDGVSTADVSLLIAALPVDGGILSQARYRITASNGLLIMDEAYQTEEPIHLAVQNGLASFTISAGLDCNGDKKLDPEEQDRGRTVLVTFVNFAPTIDIDVDSDNNNYTKQTAPFQGLPDRSVGKGSEEEIEDQNGQLGKVLGVNDNDDDKDGIRDDIDFDNPKERDLIPLVLEIPAPADIAKARINITTTEPGKIRIWKMTFDSINKKFAPRNPQPVSNGGDKVEPGEYAGTNLARLGFTPDNRVVTLYVEGLAPISGRGTERILVELDPDGVDGPDGYSANDAVRLTVMQPDVDVDTNQDGVTSDADDAGEYTKGYYTYRGDQLPGGGIWLPFNIAVRPSPSDMKLVPEDKVVADLIMTEFPPGGEMTIILEDPPNSGTYTQRLFNSASTTWRLSRDRWSGRKWAFWAGNLATSKYTVPGTYRFSLRVAIDGGFSIADEVTIVVFEDKADDLDIAMDGNRDGTITFNNSSDDKYLFWVNDDHDVIGEATLSTSDRYAWYEEDDAQSDFKDCSDNIIGASKEMRIAGQKPGTAWLFRDLEDFARVHIRIAPWYFDAGTVTLKFDPVVNGNPTINIFEAIDGGENYLSNFEAAYNQLQKKKIATIGTSEFVLDKNILTGDKLYLLFEGCTTGVGYLTLTEKDRNGELVTQKRVLLDLRHVEEMYEKNKIVRLNDGEEVGRYTGSLEGQYTYQPESDDYLLFVHGWNLEEWTKDRWAATMFKRLWWLGYKGHCGLFSWPALVSSKWPNDVMWNYDRSDQRAWESARFLRQWTNALNAKHPGKVRIIAHSQGNVVTGESLTYAGDPIHTFISTQAAMPADCFDEKVYTIDFRPFRGPDSPNIFRYYFSGQKDTGTVPYLNNVSGKVSNGMLRLFNENDYALYYWDINNQRKPDIGYGYWSPLNTYDFYDQARDRFYSTTRYYSDQPSYRGGQYKLLFPQHRFHIFSYIAESRSLALGAVPGGIKDFRSRDLGAFFGFDEKHYSHSRQFRSNMIREQGYWGMVVNEAKLPTTR